MGYFYLSIAIISEVVGTMSLKASAGFSNPVPSLIVVVGYGISFYFLALVLKSIPVGIAYATWAGVGIALVTILSALIYKQIPDIPAIIGMSLIISGVIIIHIFSKTSVH